MNLFCKMIIGCNPEMMGFIMHGLWHYVIGVGKDSGVMRVGKGLAHGTCLCKVGPALICWRPIYFLYLSPLGLQPADG